MVQVDSRQSEQRRKHCLVYQSSAILTYLFPVDTSVIGLECDELLSSNVKSGRLDILESTSVTV